MHQGNLVDAFMNNGVELYIYNVNGIMRYWLKGGVGLIEFSEDDFAALLELLLEYDKDINRKGILDRLKDKYNGR